MKPLLGWIVGFACLVAIRPLSATAAEPLPLHQRIDQIIEASLVVPPSPLCDDADYFRRLHLDLLGVIPDPSETEAFLADTSADKRSRLVDRLLAEPRHYRYLAQVFDVVWMERRADKHVKTPAWREYLRSSFAANKPYDQLAREVLGSDGVDEQLRPAVKFYLDREAEPNLLTRDVGRIFFGMDVQCAQCHDHPLIDDYLQSDYFGIYAFLSRGTIFTDAKKKISYYAEKAEGEVAFKSVFTGESGKTGPVLPGGVPFSEPTFKKGEEYKVKPAKTVRPVPKYSRRAELAKRATDGSNRAFNRNIANRLWALMMGRGLVDPVDLHHDANLPAHPELLEMLADELVAHKFDMRWLIRELALTKTYQRGFELPAELGSQARDLAARLPEITKDKEQKMLAASEAAKSLSGLNEALAKAEQQAAAVSEPLAKAREKLAQSKEIAEAARQAVSDSQEELQLQQEVLAALQGAHQQAKAALASLPEEPVLQQAVALFAARDKAASDAVAELRSQVTKQETIAAAAAAQLAESTTAYQTLDQQLAAARQQIEQHRAEVLATGQKQAALRNQSWQALQRWELATQLAEFGKADQDERAATTALAAVATNLAKLRQQQQVAMAEVSAAAGRLEQAKQKRDQAEKQLATTEQQLQAQRETTAVIGELAGQLQAAQAKLPEEKELAVILATITSRQSQATSAVTASEIQQKAEQTALAESEKQLAAATEAKQQADALLQSAQATLNTQQAAADPLVKQQDAAAARLAELQDSVTKRWSATFAGRGLTPLSPEQLAWSMMQATGMVERQERAAAAEWLKKNPLDPKKPVDQAARDAAQAQFVEQTVDAKLQGNVTAFVKLFGGGAGQPDEYFATVDQALFFANGSQLRSWLAPAGGNLTDRLVKTEDLDALAEQLYLGVLTRRPSEAERLEVRNFLAAAPAEKSARVQELAWALLTSVEFRFSH